MSDPIWAIIHDLPTRERRFYKSIRNKFDTIFSHYYSKTHIVGWNRKKGGNAANISIYFFDELGNFKY